MDRLEYHHSWAMITPKDSEQPIEEGMKSEQIECAEGETDHCDAVCKEIGYEKSDLE